MFINNHSSWYFHSDTNFNGAMQIDIDSSGKVSGPVQFAFLPTPLQLSGEYNDITLPDPKKSGRRVAVGGNISFTVYVPLPKFPKLVYAIQFIGHVHAPLPNFLDQTITGTFIRIRSGGHPMGQSQNWQAYENVIF